MEIMKTLMHPNVSLKRDIKKHYITYYYFRSLVLIIISQSKKKETLQGLLLLS